MCPCSGRYSFSGDGDEPPVAGEGSGKARSSKASPAQGDVLWAQGTENWLKGGLKSSLKQKTTRSPKEAEE